jgi:hypothetical protein
VMAPNTLNNAEQDVPVSTMLSSLIDPPTTRRKTHWSHMLSSGTRLTLESQ